MKTFWIMTCFVLLSTMAIASSEVPYAGLKAEMEGRWDDAAKIYEKTVAADPSRLDLTLRLNDIYAELKDYKRAESSLNKALKHHPKNASLYAKLSQVLILDKRPVAALSTIDKAIALEPDNLEYLRTQASLANWSGDYALAVRSYQKILDNTKDHQVLMQIALTNSWSGQLDIAAQSFKEYLALYPDEKKVYADYARTEIWRGNYPEAEKILNTYAERFGDDDDMRKIRADLYARAEWPNASHALYTPLLEKDPDDYMLNYTKTLALFYDQRPIEAIESLEKVERLQPQSKDSIDLRKFVTTRYRSKVKGSGFYLKDIDNIEHSIFSLYGTYYIDPNTSIYVGGEYDRLEASSSSAYINIDGTQSSDVTRKGIGISHRVNEYVEADLLLGQEKGDDGSIPFGRAEVRIDLHDKSTLFLNASHGYYMISPRSVSMGVERTHTGALLELRPTLSDTILIQGEYDMFSSETNNRWSGLIAPRHAVVRRESWSMDLGIKAWLFGFDKNLDQGYYDPELFESYMGTVHANYRFSQDNELFIMGGAGMIRDSTMDAYRPGGNIDLIGTFGIYQDWQLQVRTGYMNNQRETWGGDYYDAYYLGLSLLRRF